MEVLKEKKFGNEVNLQLRKSMKGQLHLIAEFFPADVLEGKDTKRIDAKTVSIRHIQLLIALQRANGSFESDQRIAKLFNYLSVEELRALLWQHKSEWISSYTKRETWISESINDVEIEESLYAEVNRSLSNITTSQNGKAKNTSKALELLRRRQSPLISYQSETGSYKLDVHIYSTAILLWYFRYTMVDHRDKWAITYKKSSAWLSAQINNKEVEKELLHTL